MPSRWCPWCGGEIDSTGDGVFVTCASCGTRTPIAAALAAPPKRPMKPDDPEAQLPPGEPQGSVPLPQGTATMSTEALIRYAVIFGSVVIAVAVLSIAIGRPILARFAQPTPTPAQPSATNPP